MEECRRQTLLLTRTVLSYHLDVWALVPSNALMGASSRRCSTTFRTLTFKIHICWRLILIVQTTLSLWRRMIQVQELYRERTVSGVCEDSWQCWNNWRVIHIIVNIHCDTHWYLIEVLITHVKTSNEDWLRNWFHFHFKDCQIMDLSESFRPSFDMSPDVQSSLLSYVHLILNLYPFRNSPYDPHFSFIRKHTMLFK